MRLWDLDRGFCLREMGLSTTFATPRCVGNPGSWENRDDLNRKSSKKTAKDGEFLGVIYESLVNDLDILGCTAFVASHSESLGMQYGSVLRELPIHRLVVTRRGFRP